MASLTLVQIALVEKLRHAEQRVERRADFMADIGDEGGFGARALFRQRERLFRDIAFARELDDKIGVVAAPVSRTGGSAGSPRTLRATATRARARRLITVPSGMPSTSAAAS